MSLFLLRSPGGSLFPGILRIAASVTPEAAKAAETRASEAAELAKAALEGNEAPTLLPPLKSAAAVAASELNASPLFSRVAVAVPVGYTELLVFVHKVSRTKRREKRRRKRPRSERVFFSLSLSNCSLFFSTSFSPLLLSLQQAKAARVYKTLLSQGKALAEVTVGAVKDSICTAPLSSFELSLFSSAAFAQAAAAAGWHALNRSTFLSLDPIASCSSSSSSSSASSPGDCVIARVLDDGASAAAPDAMLMRCSVSVSRFRRASFAGGGYDGGSGGDNGDNEIDLSRISASVRGQVAYVMPTLEEVLLVDAVPRMEGDGVLVSAWAEAIGSGGRNKNGNGGHSTPACFSSFASSRFWLRAIPRIEVEDDCGDEEELSFATSHKGKREGKLVPPAALLAAPALSSLPLAAAGRAGGGGGGGGGGGTSLLGAFLSALISPAFSELWGGQPLAVEGTARLAPRPSAPLLGRPSFGAASAAQGAAAAGSTFAASFSWASSSTSSSAAVAASSASTPAAAPLPAAFPVDLGEYKVSPLPFDVPAEAVDPSTLLSAAAGDTGAPSSETTATGKRKPRRRAVEPSLALRFALAAAVKAAAAAAAETRQRREFQQRPMKAAAAAPTAPTASTQTSKPAKKKLGPMRLPVPSNLAAFRRKGVTLVGVRVGGFWGGIFAGGMSTKKGGGAGGKAPAGASKRKAPAAAAVVANDGGETSDAPAKKSMAPKRVAAVEDPAAVAAAVAKVRAALAAGEQATKLTNDELKAFLKSAGKTVGGNKAALIERALGVVGSGGGGGAGGGRDGGPAARAAAPAPAVPVEAAAAAAAAPDAVIEPRAPALEDAKPETALPPLPPPPPRPPPPPPQAALAPADVH
jgi:hypothetical protein